MTKKKILFLVNDANFFVSTHLTLAREAKKQGHDIHVGVPNSIKILATLEREGFHHHEVTFIRGKTNPVKEIRALWSVFSILKKVNPDIAHCVTLKMVIYAGLASRWIGSIPTVLSLTGMGFIYTSESLIVKVIRTLISPFLKYALSNPKAMTLVQNPDDLEMLVRLKFVPSQQITLIKGCGVNTEVFIPGSGPNNQVPIVILTARMLLDKGVREYVEAAAILKKQGYQVRMVIVGPLDSTHPTAIAPSQIQEWKDSGVVECWGFQEDIVKVFQSADIACLPSYREGLPSCLIEAAACGLPIVTTNVPGCREVVKDHMNGILVPPADGKALAKGIEELIQDPQKRRTYGAVGRERAIHEFSEKRIISQVSGVYEKLTHSSLTHEGQVLV